MRKETCMYANFLGGRRPPARLPAEFFLSKKEECFGTGLGMFLLTGAETADGKKHATPSKGPNKNGRNDEAGPNKWLL